MLYGCRLFGILVIIVLIFHTIFVLLNLNSQPSTAVSGDGSLFRPLKGSTHSSSSLIDIDLIEHHERMYHLNKTLFLLNKDLHMLNETLHDQVQRLSSRQYTGTDIEPDNLSEEL